MKAFIIFFFSIVFCSNLLSQDIVIDSTFGDNGKLQIELIGDDIGGGVLFDAKIAPDDSYIVQAYLEKNNETYAIYKITESGELDLNFGTNGSVEIVTLDESFLPEMIILEDGKIVVTAFDDANVIKTYIFNSDGTVYNTLELFPDNKEYYTVSMNYINNYLFIGGNFASIDEKSDTIFLVKSTIDGIIDTTFGEEGMYKFGINGYSGELFSIVKQNESLILCGSENPIDITQEDFLFLMRLNIDGIVDDNFGENGIVIFDDYSADLGQLFISDDQSIFLNIFGYGVVIKMDKDGNLAKDYGIDGYAFSEQLEEQDLNLFFPEFYNGNLYLFGFGESLIYEDIYSGAIIRFNEEGKLDSTLGDFGISYTEFDFNSQYFGGLVDNQERLLAMGGSGMVYDLPMNLLLVRYKLKTSSVDELAIKNTNLYVYPNPVNGNKINLTFDLKKSQDIGIAIYNISGKMINNLYKGKSNKGINSIEFDLPENLDNGIYYFQLKSGEKTSLIKFCIAK